MFYFILIHKKILFYYSGTPVMRPQLLPHKNGHMRGVVVCQGHELFWTPEKNEQNTFAV